MSANRLTRRNVLHLAAGAGAGAAFSLPLLGARAAQDADAPGPVLVIVYLRGGVDGLSVLPPHAEPRYHALRRDTRIEAPGGGTGAALDLDGLFGLHPAMAPLQPLYDAGLLCFVHAIGSPHETRSHFDAQDAMELGTPGSLGGDSGFLARYLGGLGDSLPLFSAVAMGDALPLSLWPSPDALTVDADALRRPGRTRDYRRALRAGRRALFAGEGPVERVARRQLEASDFLAALAFDPGGAGYPGGKVGQDLALVAALVKARVGLRIAWIDIGGWDTHFRQGAGEGALAGLLSPLSAGLAAFRRDLGDELRRVVLLGLTEFGRKAAENGTGGTDHGHGAAMFALGGPVAGGAVRGRWPGLQPEQLYQGRDLAVTTDFRQLLCEVVTGHLRAPDPAAIFPGYTPTIPLGVLR